MNDLNYNVGAQEVLSLPAGSAGEGLTLFDAGGFAGNYRIVVTGSNVRLQIEAGTSSKHKLEGVLPPARFVCAGPVMVYAEVIDNALPAHGRVMVSRVDAGEPPNLAQVITAPAAVTLHPAAVAVRALTACTLTVGGVAVALAASEQIEIRGVTSLDTGTATILFEI